MHIQDPEHDDGIPDSKSTPPAFPFYQGSILKGTCDPLTPFSMAKGTASQGGSCSENGLLAVTGVILRWLVLGFLTLRFFPSFGFHPGL